MGVVCCFVVVCLLGGGIFDCGGVCMLFLFFADEGRGGGDLQTTGKRIFFGLHIGDLKEINFEKQKNTITKIK